MSNTKDKNFFSRVGRFFKDMSGELKKVVWPSKKQVANNTGIVVIFVVLAAAVVAGFDMLLGGIRTLIFGGGSK